MAITKTIELPNGDRAVVNPNDALRMRQALKALAKTNVRLSMGNMDLLDGTSFSIEIAKAVLVSYETKEGETFRELTTKERYDLIETRPKITKYLMDIATEFAAEQDKEFETDSKNS